MNNKRTLRQWRCRAKGHIFEGYLLPDVCHECRKEAESNNCGTCWLSKFDEINVNATMPEPEPVSTGWRPASGYVQQNDPRYEEVEND